MVGENTFGLSAATRIRFKYWYNARADLYNSVSTGVCNETLAAYLADSADMRTPTCDLHVDCILSELTESIKAKMASAAIFLGILPSMVAMFGPSMTQLTLLSARRPLLSLLICAGTSGFYLDRLFSMETPSEILASVHGEHLIPRLHGSPWGIAVSIAEYLLAFGSFINVLHLAIRLGDRTIMSFQCGNWFLPLIWVFMLTVIFVLVAVPFQFSAVAKHIRSASSVGARSSSRVDAGPEGPDDAQWVPLRDRSRAPPAPSIFSDAELPPRQRQNSAKQFVLRELNSGMARPPSLALREMPEFETWMAAVFNFGTFLASFQIILGTWWLSSILFLSASDAIAIVMRFFGSAIMGRLILMIELASMKAREMPAVEEEELQTPVPQSFRGPRRFTSTKARPYPGT